MIVRPRPAYVIVGAFVVSAGMWAALAEAAAIVLRLI